MRASARPRRRSDLGAKIKSRPFGRPCSRCRWSRSGLAATEEPPPGLQERCRQRRLEHRRGIERRHARGPGATDIELEELREPSEAKSENHDMAHRHGGEEPRERAAPAALREEA